MRQASRMYIRRHARPRDEQGRFLAGWELWTRNEGTPNEETRYIRSLQPETERESWSLNINDDAVRHFVVLCVVVVVAGLLALVVR